MCKLADTWGVLVVVVYLRFPCLVCIRPSTVAFEFGGNLRSFFIFIAGNEGKYSALIT